MVDQQLDWLPGVDPEIENGQQSMSPYAFGYDNAVRFNDPDGRCPTCPTAAVLPAPTLGALWEEGMQMAQEFGPLAQQAAVVITVGLLVGALAKEVIEAGVQPSYYNMVGDNKGPYAYMSKSGKAADAANERVAQGKTNEEPSMSRTGRPLPKTQTNGGRAMDPKTKQPIGGDGAKARPVTVNKGTFKQAKDAARNDRANGGKGTPVKHTQDEKGGRHFHNGSGVAGKGSESKDYGSNAGKVSNNVHYHYPKSSSN
jgi:hypothetical protein